MKTIGNFNACIRQKIPADRYLASIGTLSRKDERYPYTCYLDLVQSVVGGVLDRLKTMAPEDDPQKTLAGICRIPGLGLARQMAIGCASLEKLTELFTTIEIPSDDERRILDTFTEMAGNPLRSGWDGQGGLQGRLIGFFEQVRFAANRLAQKRIRMNDSLGDFCLRNIEKAIVPTGNMALDDAMLALGLLPQAVVFGAFNEWVGVPLDAEVFTSGSAMTAFATEHGGEIVHGFWKTESLDAERHHIEGVCDLDRMIGKIAQDPLGRIEQLVFLASHVHSAEDPVSIRFLARFPEGGNGEGGPETQALRIGRLHEQVLAYDAWREAHGGLEPKLAGVAIWQTEAMGKDSDAIQTLLNELHNRVYIDRESFRLLHLRLMHRVADSDVVGQNPWLKAWHEIRDPWQALCRLAGNEILSRYANALRLELALDRETLVAFCIRGIELRMGEISRAHAAASGLQTVEQRTAMDGLLEKRTEAVVSAFLGSIFHHYPVQVRLAGEMVLSESVQGQIEASGDITVVLCPSRLLRDAMERLGITWGQLRIARNLLVVARNVDGKASGKGSLFDLSVLESAVALRSLENGEVTDSKAAIRAMLPRIATAGAAAFVLEAGELGIAGEYALFDDLSEHGGLEETVRNLSCRILHPEPSSADANGSLSTDPEAVPPGAEKRTPRPEVGSDPADPLVALLMGEDDDILDVEAVGIETSDADEDILLLQLLDDE